MPKNWQKSGYSLLWKCPFRKKIPLTSQSFAILWAKRMHIVSFESPDTEVIDFNLQKQHFKVFYLHSKYPKRVFILNERDITNDILCLHVKIF